MMIVRRRLDSMHSDAVLLKDSQLYVVYAVLLESPVQYLVVEESSFSFPIFVSSEAVEIISARLSANMFFSPSLLGTEDFSSRAPMIGFEQIVADRSFYQNLIEGHDQAHAAWMRAKSKIDAEDQASAM